MMQYTTEEVEILNNNNKMLNFLTSTKGITFDNACTTMYETRTQGGLFKRKCQFA